MGGGQLESLQQQSDEVTRERDELYDSLTQAGGERPSPPRPAVTPALGVPTLALLLPLPEFGQYLLQENEALKRQVAVGHTVPPAYSTPQRQPRSAPGSPLRTPARSPDDAGSQLSSYKLAADDAQRRMACVPCVARGPVLAPTHSCCTRSFMEREQQRMHDTMAALEEELASTKQRLVEWQSKVCARVCGTPVAVARDGPSVWHRAVRRP